MPRTDIVTQNVDSFYNNLSTWEEKVFSEYRNLVRDENFDTVTRHRVNLKPILDALPSEIRKGLMSEYKSIIGFEKAIAGGRPETVRSGSRAMGRFSIDPSLTYGQNVDPRSVLFNRLYVQERDEGFDIGTNILRTDYLKNLVGDLSTGAAIGADPGKIHRMIVFDTETAGLATELGSVRQVSAARMTLGHDLAGTPSWSNPEMYFNQHFPTSRMQYGYLADQGVLKRMSHAMQDMFGIDYGTADPGSGDDFVNRTRQLVEDLADEHTMIAGQNVQFDVDQLLTNLSKTRVYQESVGAAGGYAELVDKARSRIQPGIVKDTLEIMRAKHPGMGLAHELKWAGEAAPFSLENVMLQTNLVSLLMREADQGGIGPDELKRILGVGGGISMMHEAQNDALIEAHLIKYLSENKLTSLPRAQHMGLGTGQHGLVQQIRRAVLRSYAPTPLSNIGDISHISREAFRAMYDEDKRLGREGTKDAAIRIRAIDEKTGRDLHGDFGGRSADELYDYLSAADAPFAKFRINPIEQEVHATRALQRLKPLEDVTDDQLIYSLGKWRNFAKPNVAYQGILNKFSTLFKRGIRPEQESFEAMRTSMADIGTPFAGLSLPERQITNAMASASALNISADVGGRKVTTVLNDLEKRAAQIGDDIGISTFVAQRRGDITPSGRNISLPLEVLRKAEEEGVISKGITGPDPYMFRLSAFQTKSGAKQVNLVYDFLGDKGAEAQRLADWLSTTDIDAEINEAGDTLRSLGLHPHKLQRIAAALPEMGAEHGIGVGFLNNQAGFAAFQAVSDINQGIISDESQLPYRAGLISHERNQVRVGAFTVDRFRDDAERAAYAENLRLAEKRSRQLEEVVKTPKNWVAAKAFVETGNGELIQKIMKGMDVFSKAFPVVVGAAALGATAYHLNKRRIEQNIYDETLSPQPTERSGYYGQYRREMGQRELPPVRYMPLDPLATAGVTGQLDRAKIGHTSMDRKYDYLYGGVF